MSEALTRHQVKIGSYYIMKKDGESDEKIEITRMDYRKHPRKEVKLFFWIGFRFCNKSGGGCFILYDAPKPRHFTLHQLVV